MARKSPRKPRKPRNDRGYEPPPFDLPKALGDIAIEWNYLEVVYHEFIHLYMFDLSQDVAAAVLNTMSSTSKAEFFEFLIAKTETNKAFLAHLDHFRKMLHIVTENRNILQHSLPSIEPRFGYEGTIYKRNRLGKPVPYKASEDDFIQIVDDIKTTRGYAYELKALRGSQIASRVGPRGMRKRPKRPPHLDAWLAYIEKPPLPHKLVPFPLGPTPTAD